MSWEALWAIALSGLATAWAFMTTSWDAAKIIGAVAGAVTIASTGTGIYLKYRTSGRQLVKRMLEFIHSGEKRLAEARQTLGAMAVLPSPALPEGTPVFPQHVLAPALKRMKWGRTQAASGALARAIAVAEERTRIALARAEHQRKEQALAHLMLGAINASRQIVDPSEAAHSRALALAEFDKALAIDPEDLDGLQYAGLMLLQMTNAAGALERFNRLIELSADASHALRLARAYRLQASAYASLPTPRLGNANSSLIGSLAAYPNSADPIEVANTHEQHGDVRTKLKTYGVANQSYQHALTIYHAHRVTDAGADGIKRVGGKIAGLNNAAASPTDNGGGPPALQPALNGGLEHRAQVVLKMSE